MPDYHVMPTDDGWVARKEGAARASSTHHTQAEAMDAARGYIANQGGGELNTHGRDGAIRAKDTIAPAHDPRQSKG